MSFKGFFICLLYGCTIFLVCYDIVRIMIIISVYPKKMNSEPYGQNIIIIEISYVSPNARVFKREMNGQED